MIDNFLTEQFKGQEIDVLLDFLNDLDDNYDWQGGLAEFPNITLANNYNYFMFVENSTENIILAKCHVAYSFFELKFVVESVSKAKFDLIKETEKFKEEIYAL
jgi:hypothetical protein